MISDYFKEIEQRIQSMSIVAEYTIRYNEFGLQEGMVRGKLLFVDGKVFEFMEYVHGKLRLKYRFHVMNENEELIFRYDNSPHHIMEGSPHHRHTPGGVTLSNEKTLMEVLIEVERLVLDIG